MAFDGDITEDVSWTEDGTITVDSDTGFFSIENGLLTLEVEIDDGLLNMVFTRQGDSAPLAPPEDPSENADGKCGTNVYWRFEEDTLYLSGTGSTYDYSSTDDIPWYSLGAEIDYVVVGEGITRLGDGALYKCQMISVSLPTTLQSIGYLTFGFCPYLGYVEIPDSVSYLGDGSFYGSALDYVYINSRSLSMDIDVFAKCEDLAAVYFYGSIVAIGEGAFGECTSTVYYPGSDSTWSGIAGKNYGGTLTWQSLDGGGSSTAMERDWYAADAFSIGLPSAWDGTYYVMTDDTNDYLTVYHKASYDEGYGGMLYSFHLFTSFSEYENIPSWQYVGGVYNTSTGEEYTLIAIFPSDVQFPSKYQDQYTHMLDSLDKLAFDGENGFTYTAQ